MKFLIQAPTSEALPPTGWFWENPFLHDYENFLFLQEFCAGFVFFLAVCSVNCV